MSDAEMCPKCGKPIDDHWFKSGIPARCPDDNEDVSLAAVAKYRERALVALYAERSAQEDSDNHAEAWGVQAAIEVISTLPLEGP